MQINNSPLEHARNEYAYEQKSLETLRSQIESARARLAEEGEALDAAISRNRTARQTGEERNAKGAAIQRDVEAWRAERRGLEADERALREGEKALATQKYELAVLEYRAQVAAHQTRFDAWIAENIHFPENLPHEGDRLGLGRKHMQTHEKALAALQMLANGDTSGIRALGFERADQFSAMFPLVTAAKTPDGRAWNIFTNPDGFTFAASDPTNSSNFADSGSGGGDGGE